MSSFTLKPHGYATKVGINDEFIDCSSDAIVVGWGFTKLSNPNEANPYSTELKKLGVITLTDFQCFEKFNVNPRITHLCAEPDTDHHYFATVSSRTYNNSYHKSLILKETVKII